MTRILYLNPPSLSRFDSAGARFQSTRKAKTMWLPTWLGYGAALAETEFDVNLIDAPAENIKLDQLTARLATLNPDLAVIYTSTPSLQNDIKVGEEISRSLPGVKVVFIGPHVTVLPEQTLKLAETAWGVARGEFEYTILELARAIDKGEGFENIAGLTWKNNGKIVHNPDRPLVEDLDRIPFVTPIYKKHLNVYNYYLGNALYPYVSVFSGRGCPARCTFCVWPQTMTGHKFRVRSPENVVAEMEYVQNEMPNVKEIFFDDDTFTVDAKRVCRICELIKEKGLHITWTVNARADLDLTTLKLMKEAGARLLVVGYESGNQQILNNIKKGVTLERLKEFTRDAKKAGLMVHGTFIIGLPGETRDTVKNSLDMAKSLPLDTAQFAVATPLPGTEFYDWCAGNGYLKGKDFNDWVDVSGYQKSVVEYPDLTSEDIIRAVDDATNAFYWRPRYFLTMIKQVFRDRREIARIRLSGWSFFKYSLKRLWQRRKNNGRKQNGEILK